MTTTTQPTKLSTYVELCERDIQVEALRLEAARAHLLYSNKLRTGHADARLLDAWFAADKEFDEAARLLRRERNAYILSLIEENERLSGVAL